MMMFSYGCGELRRVLLLSDVRLYLPNPHTYGALLPRKSQQYFFKENLHSTLPILKRKGEVNLA